VGWKPCCRYIPLPFRGCQTSSTAGSAALPKHVWPAACQI
jgi:hypothetical protein